MYALIDILLLLGLVILSHIIHKKIPFISVPLIQIVLGIVAAVVFKVTITPDYKLFMILFIAPILYSGGKHMHGGEIWKHKRPILVLAIVQVLVTALIGGAIINYFIPHIPYAVCFALVAAMSPIDSGIFSAISSRVKLPNNLSFIITAESEISDATGIILFNFAIAAALADTFSIGMAVLNLVYSIFIGILIGLAMMFVILYLTNKLKSFDVENATVYTLIQLLTPFAIYYTSSTLGMSGAAAVISAGILYSFNPNKRHSTLDANIAVVSDGAWSALLFSLTGLIYLFLGINVPSAMSSVMQIEYISPLEMLKYALIVIAVLLAERFIFSLIALRKSEGRRLYNALLSLLSGARGAVTLAACFSIPLLLKDGTPFPYRDLVLFLGCIAIIVTLLLTNFILPIVVPKHSRHENSEEAAKAVNKKIIQTVIERLNDEMNAINKPAVEAVISYYESLLIDKSSNEGNTDTKIKEVDILLIGNAAEKEEIEKIQQSGKYAIHNVKHVSDSIEMMRKHLIKKDSRIFDIWYHLRMFFMRGAKVEHDEVARMKLIAINAAIRAIRNNVNSDNEAISQKALAHYGLLLKGLTQSFRGEDGNIYTEMKKEFHHMAIQIQKSSVQRMLENSEITHGTAAAVKKYIKFAELALLTQEL